MKRLWLVSVLFLTGCGSGWPLLVFNVPLGGRTEIGQQGPPGEPGLACWDLNGNGECDGDEDWRGDEIMEPDGFCDAFDCRGADGQDGDVGATGVGDPGRDGADGSDGEPGVGVQGPRGDTGAQGPPGVDGQDGVGPCPNGNPHSPCDP